MILALLASKVTNNLLAGLTLMVANIKSESIDHVCCTKQGVDICYSDDAFSLLPTPAAIFHSKGSIACHYMFLLGTFFNSSN